MFVALLPDENQINKELRVRIVPPNSASRYDFDMPQKQLGKVLRDSGVGVIDLLPVFREDPRCLYMNDTHWNPDGHQLAAKAITQALAPTLDSRGVK